MPKHGYIDALFVAVSIAAMLVLCVTVIAIWFCRRNRSLWYLGSVGSVSLTVVGFIYGLLWPLWTIGLPEFVARGWTFTHGDADCPQPGNCYGDRHNRRSD